MKILRKAIGTIMVCLTLVMMSTTAGAQQTIHWQGVVKPSEVNVYSDPSTHVAIATTLRQGDVVDVLLEINAMGAAYCRIAPSGQSEPLGYVLCLNLDRSTNAPKHVAYNSTVATQTSETISAPKLTEASAAISTVMTNKDIVDLNKVGFPSSILVAKIKSSQCNFDTSSASLQALKTAGLADSVILAMVEAPSGQPTPATVPDSPDVVNASNHPPPTTVTSSGKTRVFVTDSQSWEMRGGGAASGNKKGWGGSSWMAGGARPQTVEIIKTLNQRCPEITVTNNLENADFVLTLDHEGGKSLLAHRNKIAVFNKEGDDIFSNSTLELGNSVKDACQVILSSTKR
jgi:hypothetical protein